MGAGGVIVNRSRSSVCAGESAYRIWRQHASSRYAERSVPRLIVHHPEPVAMCMIPPRLLLILALSLVIAFAHGRLEPRQGGFVVAAVGGVRGKQ